MNIDARVSFPQELAPVDEDKIRAVLGLEDALARGDHDAMFDLLDESGRQVLEELDASGGWDEATSEIEAVRVVFYQPMPTPTGLMDAVAFAIQEPGQSYLLAFVMQEAFGEWIFVPGACTDEVRARATDWDGTTIAELANLGGIDAEDIAGAMEGMIQGLPADQQKLVREAMGAQDESTDKPRKKKKKNTPGGPVNIPESGG